MDYQQAYKSLNTVATVQRRTRELRNYRNSGSIVSVWGIVWFVAFGSQQLSPGAAPIIWIIGWAGALVWTFTRPRKSNDWQALATWIVAFAFIALLLMVIRADARMAAMVFSLVMAAGYAMLGIWAGKRFLALASIVLVTSCIGWWLLQPWLFGLLAVGGGFALIIGGIWLRRP